MCIKLTQDERDTIDAIILDALSDLLMTQFRVSVAVFESDDSTGCPDGHSLGAEITIDYRNLQATIGFYPLIILGFRKDPYSIIPVIYHEVAHLVTSRFKDLVWPLLNLDIQYEKICTDANENTTEILGRLALKYRQSFDENYKRGSRNEYEKGNDQNIEQEAEGPDKEAVGQSKKSP